MRPVARVQIMFAVVDIREWKSLALDKRWVFCGFLLDESGRGVSQGSGEGRKANDVCVVGELGGESVCRDGVDIAVGSNEGEM